MFHKIFKNIIFILCFSIYLTNYSSSEISAKEWNKQCNEDKSTCIIVIKNEIKVKDNDKKQRLATAYIQIGSSKQKKMNLINEGDQTYKLSEENKNIPILFVNLPLNTDLRFKPLIQIDDKNYGKLNFTNCNNTDGCKTNAVISNDAIDKLKKGNTMSVIVRIFGINKNMKIEFPLKQFTKSYTKLIKK